MIKPNGFEETREYGEYTPLALGGHKLTIMQVEECVTSMGNEYLKVSFDTSRDDIQPNYYSNAYKNDTREQKKWSGVTTVFPTDKDGKTSRAFKTFCTSIEHSNAGFKIVWGEKFCEALKGKAVGGVFGEEEYLDAQGEVKTAIKLFWFCGIDKAADANIPNKRTVEKEDVPVYNPYSSATSSNFEAVGDDDLPF